MKPTFLHESTSYVFRGKALTQPAPGTYDASRWTPPTHALFCVRIWNDGSWAITIGNSDIPAWAGDYEKRSRKNALALLLKYCGGHFKD